MRQVASRLVVATLIAIVIPGSTSTAADARLTEAQAKALFLYNCAMFVQWPPAAMRNEFLIGIIGADVAAAVADMVQGRRVDGRVLHARVVAPNDDLRQYHIVFVGDRARMTAEQIAAVRDVPVLTVGEASDFTASGGIVRLYTEQERLRFEINMKHVERAGLQVSAKMLALATVVR